ncbi:hypothetical protein ACRYCC_26065 [Actinomadura scrupuli]|uniref:hypothetical protein n=1 Tax=Actinomadura scrupuli TaxID=559629 RepID=UPI003D98D29C
MNDLLIYGALAVGLILSGIGLVVTASWWLNPDRRTPEPLPVPTVTELAQEMHAADVAAWDERAGTPPPASSRHYLRHAHIAHGHITGRAVTRRG